MSRPKVPFIAVTFARLLFAEKLAFPMSVRADILTIETRDFGTRFNRVVRVPIKLDMTNTPNPTRRHPEAQVRCTCLLQVRLETPSAPNPPFEELNRNNYHYHRDRLLRLRLHSATERAGKWLRLSEAALAALRGAQ
jgi:hypothetical protein